MYIVLLFQILCQLLIIPVVNWTITDMQHQLYTFSGWIDNVSFIDDEHLRKYSNIERSFFIYLFYYGLPDHHVGFIPVWLINMGIYIPPRHLMSHLVCSGVFVRQTINVLLVIWLMNWSLLSSIINSIWIIVGVCDTPPAPCKIRRQQLR